MKILKYLGAMVVCAVGWIVISVAVPGIEAFSKQDLTLFVGVVIVSAGAQLFVSV